MQISDLAGWVRALDDRRSRPCSQPAAHARLLRRDRARLPVARPAGGHAVGGESQRIKMIRHLGSALTDVTYVFDEPTIGLHPHDIQRMNDLLLQLRDKGNTVLVVEHKPETIAIADHVVDLGPGRGHGRRRDLFEGTVEGLRASETVTGRHLDDRAALKAAVRTPTGALEVRGRQHPQPAEGGRRHPARGARRGHRRRRVREELADPRLGVGPGRGGGRRPGPDQGLAAQQPGHLHRRCSSRSARRSPRRTASNRRCSAPTPRGPARAATARASSTPTSAMMAGVATTCEVCDGKRFEAAVLEYKLGGRTSARYWRCR